MNACVTPNQRPSGSESRTDILPSMLSHLGLVIGTSSGRVALRFKANEEYWRNLLRIPIRNNYKRVHAHRRHKRDAVTPRHPPFVFISHTFSTINVLCFSCGLTLLTPPPQRRSCFQNGAGMAKHIRSHFRRARPLLS